MRLTSLQALKLLACFLEILLEFGHGGRMGALRLGVAMRVEDAGGLANSDLVERQVEVDGS